jgi:hypothetical protein
MQIFADVESEHALVLGTGVLEQRSDHAARIQQSARHVRAASGLAPFGNRIGLIQDDTRALIWLDASGSVMAETPLNEDGSIEHFDEILGNKHRKDDLEAAVSFTHAGDAYWLALGSGSTPARDRAVLLNDQSFRWLSLSTWYQALRSRQDFCAGALNIEAAFVYQQRFFLVQRGNGRQKNVNAIAEFALDEVCAFLQGSIAAPNVARVTPVQLGAIADAGGNPVRWSFADACVIGSRIWFLLSAEDSPDAVADGPVLGTALAYCDDLHFADLNIGSIHDLNQQPVCLKLEGLCALDASTLLAVSDQDDPREASRCLRIKLRAQFRGAYPP